MTLRITVIEDLSPRIFFVEPISLTILIEDSFVENNYKFAFLLSNPFYWNTKAILSRLHARY